jgi:hypothetical protein
MLTMPVMCAYIYIYIIYAIDVLVYVYIIYASDVPVYVCQ